MIRVGAIALVGVLWLGTVTGCTTRLPEASHDGVLALVTDRGEPGASGGARSVPPAEVVPAHAPPDVPAFSVLARSGRLQKAPCINCHTVPLAAMRWTGADGHARAHWPVELRHASDAVMSCVTCHAPDDLDALRMLAGAPVSFDHAYEVCAQCHSTQAADWVGGAHGKRVGGWAPPRVIYNCTECHDPHQPLLPARWPARAGQTSR